MADGATNSGSTAGLTSGTPQSAALTDAATEKIAAATSQAREKVLGAAADKGASITVKFEAEDKALHAKILADAKADDREPNKYLLRWVRQNYKVGAVVLILMVAATLGLAQDKPKGAPAVAPVISLEQRVAYFKARAEAGEASTQAQQAAQTAQQKQVGLQESVKAITDTCGKDFLAQFDAQGNPVCAAKPKEAEKK